MLREVYAMAISKEAMLKLQNGSDVRGVAVAGVEGQPVTLTPETAQLIARAMLHCWNMNPPIRQTGSSS